MHIVHHDKKTARLFLEASGFWDLAEAMTFYTEVTAACREATRSGGKLSILSDLTEYLAQGGPVSDTHAQTAAQIARTPKHRYAIVAPTALNRMRLRRLLDGVDFQIFPDVPSATAWLGWDTAYVVRLPHPAASPAIPAQPNLGRAAA